MLLYGGVKPIRVNSLSMVQRLQSVFLQLHNPAFCSCATQKTDTVPRAQSVQMRTALPGGKALKPAPMTMASLKVCCVMGDRLRALLACSLCLHIVIKYHAASFLLGR